jgi:XTP/dITP diphosphohydrolase
VTGPRIVVLLTSPRVPAGLLTASAWDLLRAHPVLAGAESDQVVAVRAVGVPVGVVAPDQAVSHLLRDFAALTRSPEPTPDAESSARDSGAEPASTVVWLAAPDGDLELTRDLRLRLLAEPGLAEMEVRSGSWDLPGARLLDVVAVLDRLAGPDGDPWKREQTHRSLARFLLEEAYEAYDAIEEGDPAALREELGDVLLQVVLHARLAEEGDPAWNIDELATGLVEKMIRRNPHVFAGVAVNDLDEITRNWERIKREEKPDRTELDGIPASQPALALAQKILSRARRAGLHFFEAPAGQNSSDATPARDPSGVGPEPGATTEADGALSLDDAELGERLFALVARADAAGLDAEASLRRVALRRLAAARDSRHRPVW